MHIEARDRREFGYFPYRAGMVLLGCVVAYPSLGPALFGHLHHAAADAPRSTWAEFGSGLRPDRNDRPHGHGLWRNAADPSMTSVRAQRWQALLDALDSLEIAVGHTDPPLPLPEPTPHCLG